MLKVNLDECCTYRCHGGARAGAQKMLGGRCRGPNRFCSLRSRGAKCCSQVLSWDEISAGTAELPRCNCRWMFIYLGSWDEQGGRWAWQWRVGLLPEGQISERDKAESKQKERQIGKCCGWQTQCVVLGS